MMLFSKIPSLFKLAKEKPVVGCALSISLSLAIGHLFGAAGMICMIAGLTSTLVSFAYYSLAAKLKGLFNRETVYV